MMGVIEMKQACDKGRTSAKRLNGKLCHQTKLLSKPRKTIQYVPHTQWLHIRQMSSKNNPQQQNPQSG